MGEMPEAAPTGGWCFRLRIELAAASRLECQDPEWAMLDEETTRVVLRPLDTTVLADARRLELRGRGYPDEAAAAAAGGLWRDRLMLTFACLRVGADFGDREPDGIHVSPAGVQAVAGSSPFARAFPDSPGVVTFECEPGPVAFVRAFPGRIMLSFSHDLMVDAAERVIASGITPTAQQRMAFDLFSASKSEDNVDARFVMLMMAVETLIDQKPRPAASQALIRQTMASLDESNDITAKEKLSLRGSLKYLLDQSISQAGQELAASLDQDFLYDGANPVKFFKDCYSVRSALVHGYSDPRPSRDEVDRRGSHLELFVAHLIAGPLSTGL